MVKRTAADANMAAQRGRPKKAKNGDSSAQKFYAVRAGRTPGVYYSWADCQHQTSGWRGAVYKAFFTVSDAEAFVAGKEPVKTVHEQARFYAVAVGNPPGVYTAWTDAQRAIKGVKGPRYKRFDTEKNAVAFVREHGRAAAKSEAQDDEDGASTPVPVAAKKKAMKQPPPVVVYTDGSCLANGRANAAAGVGVYFGPGDERNISQRLPGALQTNQRAELTAILLALQATISHASVLVWTDSRYAQSSVLEWAPTWRKNGWKTSVGQPVKNDDLIQRVVAVLDQRTRDSKATEIRWVKAHDTSEGNIAADRLAVAGARAEPETGSVVDGLFGADGAGDDQDEVEDDEDDDDDNDDDDDDDNEDEEADDDQDEDEVARHRGFVGDGHETDYSEEEELVL